MQERYEMFTSLVININRYISKIKNDQTQEMGLKGNHVQCLYYLYNETNGLTAKQLSELCEEDKAAISRTLRFLETSELVTIEESNSKKYRNPYKLTEKGKEFGKKIADKINGIMEIASKGIDERNRKILYASLNTICENLKHLCKK